MSGARAHLALGLVLLAACGGNDGPAKPGGDRPTTPGQPVSLALPGDRQAELGRIEAELAASATMTGAEFAQRYQVPFAAALGYDPAQASDLALIQASMLKLEPAELTALGRQGFVISGSKRYPSFTYGYEAIYSQDLPLYVSADSILNAVHQSYDNILEAVELASLIPELRSMLAEMRARLAAGGGGALGQTARGDADLFVAVAASLLAGSAQPPVAGAPAADVTALVTKASAASGTQDLELFGVGRTVDFSQFTPRGHYTDSPELERYFRAMMWLGRIELPIIQPEIAAGGAVKQVFNRHVLEAALVLSDLVQAETAARWQHIDGALRAFVGEPDSMSPADATSLRAALGLTDLGGLAALADGALAQAIVDGGYGQQRIASQIVLSPPHAGTLPLAATFLLLGQRYVVDSHVFSNLVYDRLNKPGAPARMMPKPLDVAFAALGNDQAGALLAAEVAQYGYAPELHGMRYLVDAHGADFWTANLYNRWLSALRALSPRASGLSSGAAGLPSVAATEAWGRRLVNTQLASWAELRHDTILYAKQSYTGGITCEYPDAYVEPYPAFFAELGAFAAAGGALVGALDLSSSPGLATDLTTYFTNLGQVAGILQAMAERQRTGAPHDPAHIDFINRAVRFQPGCGAPAGATGWYPELFYGADVLAFDPTIADVHTQPTDEAGNDVGRVLHVGTGYARLMVVTVNTCSGPRAYAGLASSYHEQITEHYDRLDDQRWSARFTANAGADAPGDVVWMSDLVAR